MKEAVLPIGNGSGEESGKRDGIHDVYGGENNGGWIEAGRNVALGCSLFRVVGQGCNACLAFLRCGLLACFYKLGNQSGRLWYPGKKGWWLCLESSSGDLLPPRTGDAVLGGVAFFHSSTSTAK